MITTDEYKNAMVEMDQLMTSVRSELELPSGLGTYKVIAEAALAVYAKDGDTNSNSVIKEMARQSVTKNALLVELKHQNFKLELHAKFGDRKRWFWQ